MPDILLRDVALNLKRDIEDRAKISRQSLSAEIKRLIRIGLEQDQMQSSSLKNTTPLDAMIQAFAECKVTDEENAEFIRALERHRKELPRPVREFE